MARQVTIKAKTAMWGFGKLGIIRFLLGFVFFWAFLDKTFGLGFATCRDVATNTVNMGCSASWLQGGSPTSGFLEHATKGPLADVFQSLAGMMWVDWLFMLGLLGIGLSLMLGIAVRIGAVSGVVLMMLMWLAALWPANNPFIDEHIIYALVLVVLAIFARYDTGILTSWWRNCSWVRNNRWLI